MREWNDRLDDKDTMSALLLPLPLWHAACSPRVDLAAIGRCRFPSSPWRKEPDATCTACSTVCPGLGCCVEDGHPRGGNKCVLSPSDVGSAGNGPIVSLPKCRRRGCCTAASSTAWLCSMTTPDTIPPIRSYVDRDSSEQG